MKCFKCGKEIPSKNGICQECYQEIIENKYRKRKVIPKNNFILSHLDKDEKIINKVKTNKAFYYLSFFIITIAILLFRKTIFEFGIQHQKSYFLMLIFNVLLLFFGIYLIMDFMARDIYLTNKRIIGKWGLFHVQKINIPLESLNLITTPSAGKLEFSDSKKNYLFEFVGNAQKIKHLTIEQKFNT